MVKRKVKSQSKNDPKPFHFARWAEMKASQNNRLSLCLKTVDAECPRDIWRKDFNDLSPCVGVVLASTCSSFSKTFLCVFAGVKDCESAECENQGQTLTFPSPSSTMAGPESSEQTPRHTARPQRHTDQDRRLIPNMPFQSLQQAGFLTAAPSAHTGATCV